METEINYIVTPQIKRLQLAVREAVNRNSWLVITGEWGVGKTEFARYTQQVLESDSRNVVVRANGFRSRGSRLAPIMKSMVRALAPDLHCPSDLDLRYEALRRALLRAVGKNQRILLMIDNAEDLNEATIREIKKIHEISAPGRKHCFGVLFVGQPRGDLESVLGGVEIGYRVARLDFHGLNDKQVIEFATERFGLEFPRGDVGEKTQEYFVAVLSQRTPLGIEYMTRQLATVEGFDGVARIEHIRAVLTASRRSELARYKITQEELRKRYYEIFEAPISAATAHNYAHGNAGVGQSTVDKLDRAMQSLIAERSREQSAPAPAIAK